MISELDKQRDYSSMKMMTKLTPEVVPIAVIDDTVGIPIHTYPSFACNLQEIQNCIRDGAAPLRRKGEHCTM